MSKVVIAISRGSIARNLLQNDFYKLLREEYKLLMLTQGCKDERFKMEFGHPNVTMEPLGEDPHTWGDRVIFFFHKYLIYNKMTEFMSRYGIIGDPRAPKAPFLIHIIRKAIFLPLSKLTILRDLLRFIDLHFLQKDEVARFRALYRKEKPAVVIVTNITDDLEAAMLKAARLEGVFSFAMPKSWDNLSTHGFRAKSDALVVWSEFMKEQALRYQNYSDKSVHTIGIPQFDYYVDPKSLWTREEFCRLYDLDPACKIIMFGSEGKLIPSDADIAAILASMVERNELTEPVQLLLRPHYGYRDDEKKFVPLKDKPFVSVDLLNNPSEGFRDRWDYSKAFMERFANCLYHSDIIINTASTLVLDAAAFGKPIISIAFNGNREVPQSVSVARWYDPDYYQEILKVRATTLVRNIGELKTAINAYLDDPHLKEQERKSLVKRFCENIDGGAGGRFFELVKTIISSQPTQ